MYQNMLMTRKGILNVKGASTTNQCARPGHQVYHYEIKILFDNHVRLDENGMIIDHQQLDNVVQITDPNSCEVMSNDILSRIQNLLKAHNLEKYCIGIKLKIQPAFVVDENSAYFQLYRSRIKEDSIMVMNL